MVSWSLIRQGSEAVGSDAGIASPSDIKLPAPTPKKPKLALALGGGAARGWAHIGVLKALDEAGIEILSLIHI